MRQDGKTRKRECRKAVVFLTVLFSVVFLCGCARDSVSALFASEGPLAVESTSTGKYAYQTLTEEERLIYDQIVDTIEHRKSDIRVATKEVNILEKVYQAVRSDHAEYFWVKNLSYEVYRRGKTVTAIDIRPEYSMTEKRQKKYQTRIDQEVKKMLKKAPKKGTDYEKVRYVYETLIDQVDYDESVKNSQNIISTFVRKRTVCQGYAYGTQYLLGKLGVDCATVEGTAHNQNHAWNLVRMDGDFYYVDTTWGNSQFVYGSRQDEETSGKFINYSYLGATTEDISRTHSPSDGIRLPVCTAVENNYFVKEGLYFQEFTPDGIGQKLKESYEAGSDSLQMKFASQDIYEQVMQYFVEDFHVADYCPGLTTLSYVENTDEGTLLIVFRKNPGNAGDEKV